MPRKDSLQKYLVAILENTEDVAVIKDLELRVLAANSAFLRKLGAGSIDEILGKTDAELFEHPPEEEPVKSFMEDERHAQKLRKGESLVKEEIVNYPSGETRVFLTRKFPIFDDDGEIFATANISSDITEKRKTGDHFEKLLTAVKNSPSMILITDREGRIEYVNPRFTEVTGFSFEDAVGKKPNILRSGNQPEDYYRELWRTILSGNVWQRKIQNRKKNGELYWSLMSIAPVRDENGEITHFVQNAEDITKSTLLEEEIREKEERLRLITSNSYDLVWELDAEGRFFFANQRAVDLLGYSPEEFAGMKFTDILHPEDLENIRRKTLAIVSEISRSERESARVRAKDGKWTWVEVAGTSYRNPRGEVRIVASARDITERKEFETRLEEVNRTQELILAYSPVGILYVKNNTVQWANARFREMSGYAGDFEDLDVSVFFPGPTGYQMFRQRWYPVLEQGLTVVTEERFKRIDGSVIWCSLKGKTFDPHSPKEGTIWLFEDITELKNSRRVRRMTDARVRALYVLSQVLHKTEEEIVAYSLEMALELTESRLGYLDFLKTGDAGIESGIYAFSRTASLSMEHQGAGPHPLTGNSMWARCIRSGKPEIVNERDERRKFSDEIGRQHPIERYIILPFRENRETIAVIGVANKADPYDEIDLQQIELFIGQVWQILQRKRDQETMKENDALFRAMTSAASEAIIVFDGKGTIAVWNESAEKLFGRTADEAIGESVFEILRPAGDPETFRRFFKERGQRHRSHEENAVVEIEFLKRDGKTIETELSLVTFRKGREWWGLAVFRNIEDRKRTERLKEDLRHITSHDLKTPLAGILNVPSLLLENPHLSEEEKKLLVLVRESVSRMLKALNLSNNIMKIESKAYRLSPQEFDLAAVFDSIERDLAYLLVGKRIRIDYLIDAKPGKPAGGIPLRGEEHLVYLLLENLLKNAAEASPADAAIGVVFEDRGEVVYLRITNSGSVPEEIRHVFFEKFVTRNKKDGTGLGAYSAKLITELHGGKIALDTGEEGKTSIWFVLPKRMPSLASVIGQ